jgi:glutathione synthase/RimK-type ligase-like ATP-grasp enzyme
MHGARTLKRRLGYARRNFAGFWREAAQQAPDMGPVARAAHILRGYHPLEAAWYEQERRSTRGCISTFERETSLTDLNGPHGYLLDNKLAFAHVMRSAGLPHPDLFAFAHGRAWHWLDDGRAKALAGMARGEAVVVKPTFGRKGQSVQFLRTPVALDAAPTQDVIATGFVQQADYAQRIFAGSLNTIRILSVIPRDGAPVVAAAMHRFGAAATGGVDNFSAGGVVARVDLATGRLDRAARIGQANRLLWSEAHPETGARIAGVGVPHWPAVHALVQRLCALLPFLTYVGWDIAMTGEGPVVIEGNARPSLRFFQLYEPMLDDPRLRDFFIEAARGGR